jgi:uncharacterized membrane protein
MNSDTPRTDNVAGDGTTVPADFAADLERELAAMTARADELHKFYDDVLDRAEKAEAEVERLWEELDRLKGAIPTVLTHIDGIGARGYYSGKTLEEDAAIEALRAALKETK